MYPAIPVSKNDNLICVHTRSQHSRPPFSCASHFALVLMAPVLGVGYAFIRKRRRQYFLSSGSLFDVSIWIECSCLSPACSGHG